MKRFAIVLSLSLLLSKGGLVAQEKIPSETATKAAALLLDASAKLEGLPLKVEADGDKPFGLTKDGKAALVLPQKNLEEKTLAKPAKQVQPIGQLWIKGLTPMVNGSAIANEKLLLTTVNVGGEDHEVALLLLGIREKDGKAEVVVYSKGKEPLVSLPVESVSQGQEQPIELEVRNPKDNSGDLAISILGKHQTKLTLTLR